VDDDAKAKLSKRARERAARKSYGIQFNVQKGGDMYAPSRDFAHNYPRMIEQVVRCFNQDYWPELYKLYVECYTSSKHRGDGYEIGAGASEEAFAILEKTKDVYCKFINESYKRPGECCDDVLQRVGWLDLPVAAQVTWLAMLGQVMTGQLFAGVRDLYMGGETPADFDVLMAAGHDARRAMNKIDKSVEVARDTNAGFRSAVRAARAAGLSFDEIAELCEDVKHGRVPAG